MSPNQSGSDLAYTLASLAGWVKGHGIYQLRAVFDAASTISIEASDSEALAGELLNLAHHVESTGELPTPQAPEKASPPAKASAKAVPEASS